MSTTDSILKEHGRGIPTPAAFGRRLAVAREGLHLSLEDAAHQTRIHSRSLRWLEEGNIAAFGSITYARSFIRAYSAFLGVDPARFLQTLPERGQLGGRQDYRYLTESQGCWLRERDSAVHSHAPRGTGDTCCTDHQIAAPCGGEDVWDHAGGHCLLGHAPAGYAGEHEARRAHGTHESNRAHAHEEPAPRTGG